MRAVIVFDHPYGGKASENVAHRRSFPEARVRFLNHTQQRFSRL
ncbi:hypothetical protein PVOR_30738 [Paenibacillus vortex V453]|uniref:Flavodoxin-like fold domain-containing protein n=1 Tax=Paenibacillus vortex V453 TaxID=715225 RepID=A0A2R9SM88_9BACL|nr:hypothetical protein [Paenibacillus vortex]EFU38470.1 hypothetical protein PVOR_30738 [Paenibacillus vortex V453]